MPTMNRSRTASRQAAPEAPEAGREGEDRDREDVQDALDEHRAERPAERRVAVHLEQVGAVHVAELGRHDAVDEPRDVQDLGRVAQVDDEAGLAQQPLPAVAAQREPEIEDRRTASRTSAGLACRMSVGTCARRSRFRYRKNAMIASGTTIDRIVRGWRQPLPDRDLRRRRWTRARARRRAIRVRGFGCCASSAGVASIASEPSEPSGSPAIGRRSCPSGPLMPRRRDRVGPARTSAGATRPFPRTRLTPLASGVQSRTKKRGAARDDLDVAGQCGQQPGRCRRVAVERDVGDPDLHDRMRIGDRDAGQAELERELGGLLVALADEPRVVRLDPVDRAARCAPSTRRAAASRASGRTDAGCRPGRPARGPPRSSPPRTCPAGWPARGRGR